MKWNSKQAVRPYQDVPREDIKIECIQNNNSFMSAILISDLHLHESDLATYDKFERFLSQKLMGFNLFILGDLFETWIGDDNNPSLIKAVLKF